jgi:protein-S-isoprenylcysteine O-methyltransferase Ste14
MSLQSWLHNRRGEWYVAVQVALMIAVFLAPKLDGRVPDGNPEWSEFIVIFGGVFFGVGLVIALLGLITLGHNLSPYPKPRMEAELVESGIYSIVRHPIYSGIILFAFGWGLAWSSILAVAGSVIFFFFFDLKSRREERWLETKFADYARYKKRVKKIVQFIY